MIISEKRSSILCARAMKRAAAAMPGWVAQASSLRVADETRRQDACATKDAKWRRVSGMTAAIEPFMDLRERRAAIGRLVKWLKRKTAVVAQASSLRGLDLDAARPSPPTPLPLTRGRGENGGGAGAPDFAQTGMSAPLNAVAAPLNDVAAPLNEVAAPLHAVLDCNSQAGMPALLFLRMEEERIEKARLSLTAEWDFSVREWSVSRERSVESLCRELGISHGGLTRLTKEYSGATAQEIIDGFKVGRMKHVLMEQLRELARALWGVPGDYVKMRCIERPRTCMTADGDFFRQSQQEMFEETEEEAIERREREIFSAVGSIDFLELALRCGFGSAARFKAACVNVFGKSIKALMKIWGREVLEFYLCAEQKALRELASREPANAMVMRARTLYWDSEVAPSEPFMDRWSAAEFGRRDWLMRMWDAFG